MDTIPIFNIDFKYSKVAISFKCKEITNFIVINPLVVLVTWIYPSPSTKPTKKAIKEGGITINSFSSGLITFFNLRCALAWVIPITGKLLNKISLSGFHCCKQKFVNSTISCPTQGIALIRFVITVAPHKLICPYGKT
jgi:hypothetical protein